MRIAVTLSNIRSVEYLLAVKYRSLKSFIALIDAVCIVASLNAQPHFTPLSSISGAAAYAIAYHDGYLYSGEGNTLSIYDAGPGTAPPYARLYRRRFLSFIDDILIDKNLLYLCANTDGLYVFDIADPAQPQLTASWKPASWNAAVYDVALSGDTVFVANKTRITVLRRNGQSFDRITDISVLTNPNSRVRGCSVKDTLLAFTVATLSLFPSALDGVYLYDARTLQKLSFHGETFGDAEDVVFGQKTPLLHVLGGGQFTSSLPFPLGDPRGHYYVLDISDPAAPVDVFHDTIPGISGLGDSEVLDAAMRNDTMYLATRTGDDQVFPLDGNVFVYDATDPDSIAFLTDISVGLLHFDVTLQGPLMHVSSEWYGIRTIDLHNLFAPVDLGDTRTGGWCAGTDIYGHWMVQANEGYGTQLFDISDKHHPQLIGYHDNVDAGFNYNARFSADGKYIYCCYTEGLTLDEFRVLETATMEQIGTLNFFTGYEDCYVYGNRFVSYTGRVVGQNYITMVDVSQPTSPQLLDTKSMQIGDMRPDHNGRLWVCRTDSLLVYEIADAFVLTDAISADGDPFRCVAIDGDTVSIYRDSGLWFYTYDNGIRAMNSVGTFPHGAPEHLAMDSKVVYAGYTSYGLSAFDRNTGIQLDTFRTGLDFIFPEYWPLENLQVIDSLIVLTEYFGQTTLLTFGDTTTGVFDLPATHSGNILITPNPATDLIHIMNPDHEPFDLQVYDLSGHQIDQKQCLQEATVLSVNWPAGVYLLALSRNGTLFQSEKFIVLSHQ